MEQQLRLWLQQQFELSNDYASWAAITGLLSLFWLSLLFCILPCTKAFCRILNVAPVALSARGGTNYPHPAV